MLPAEIATRVNVPTPTAVGSIQAGSEAVVCQLITLSNSVLILVKTSAVLWKVVIKKIEIVT